MEYRRKTQIDKSREGERGEVMDRKRERKREKEGEREREGVKAK